MPATINWVVRQMDCYPEYESETDVVFTVHWSCVGNDGDFSGYSYGAQYVSYASGTPFTPYSDLTQDQVIGWVKDAMGAEVSAGVEASVLGQIEDQKNPKSISPPLPWASN